MVDFLYLIPPIKRFWISDFQTHWRAWGIDFPNPGALVENLGDTGIGSQLSNIWEFLTKPFCKIFENISIIDFFKKSQMWV
jgi:hypothetical protein